MCEIQNKSLVMPNPPPSPTLTTASAHTLHGRQLLRGPIAATSRTRRDQIDAGGWGSFAFPAANDVWGEEHEVWQEGTDIIINGAEG